MPLINEEKLQKRLDNVIVNKALDAQVARGELRAALRGGGTPPTVSNSGMFQPDGTFLDWMRVGDAVGSAKPLI